MGEIETRLRVREVLAVDFASVLGGAVAKLRNREFHRHLVGRVVEPILLRKRDAHEFVCRLIAKRLTRFQRGAVAKFDDGVSDFFGNVRLVGCLGRSRR